MTATGEAGTDARPSATAGPAHPDWVRFRKQIIDRLCALDARRFVYLDSDRVLGVCPVCMADLPEYLAVRFHGRAPRADLWCSLGCPEADLANVLGVEVLA